MKAFFPFLVLVLLCSVSAFGQVSAGDTVMVWRYADVSYPIGGFNTKAKVSVDYGESSGWFKAPEMIEGADGKAVKLKSPVDALNWMSERGWELVQSYQAKADVTGLGMSGLEYLHFIMRRMEPRKKG